VSLGEKKELGMSQFGLKFTLPAPGASDVATRELTITVNGGDPPQVKLYPGATLVTDEMIFNQDDTLSITLVDVDGAGNRSPASAAFVYTVTDDVPPPQPGSVGVTDKRQI
jgi:hypothetical protein